MSGLAVGAPTHRAPGALVGYNWRMAQAGGVESTPERGCGPLSPLYDEAMAWAAHLHRRQMRKNTKVPYIAHLAAVSSIVLEDGGTETEAIAGLLHDAVEDCGAQIELILRQRFGDDVGDIVMGCSDAAPADGQPKAAWPIRKQDYVDRLRKTDDLSAIRVSGADKLHNARATLVDLGQSEPRGTWSPHNACHHQSLWYYQAVSDVITSRLPRSRTGAELATVVAALYTHTGDGIAQPAEAQPLVPACPADPKCEGAALLP
ncbi:MAG: HD domain-containing protein [Actinomycetota bacterium]